MTDVNKLKFSVVDVTKIISANAKAIEGLNNKYDFLIRNELSSAIKPKQIQIESEP